MFKFKHYNNSNYKLTGANISSISTAAKVLGIVLLFFTVACTTAPVKQPAKSANRASLNAEANQQLSAPSGRYSYSYEVDLRDLEADIFKVTMEIDSLPPESFHFSFAASGPFIRHDFGRYVRRFEAYDHTGNILKTRQITPNRWVFEQAHRLKKIYYEIEDTRDHSNRSTTLPPMLGSTIQKNYVFMSGQSVFGIVNGLENRPMSIRLRYPSGWVAGSALASEGNNRYSATNFGELISSPVLFGKLDIAEQRIHGSEVSLFTYSKSGQVRAEEVLACVESVLNSFTGFMGELPLDYYTMLFVFDDQNGGGVEYRDNAAFVFRDEPFSKIRQDVQDVIAHEYFHLIIPFSIRSDAIMKRRGKSQPTAHLWFIEGVTEWASDMMQLRSGDKRMEDYLIRDFRDKLFKEDFHRSGVSLQQISLNPNRSMKDYLSVYSRGALVAALFDIHLLDLSHGRRGLREVIRDLHLDFGDDRPLPEEEFFEILIDYSGPEFEAFIRRYIIGNEPLPVKEYLDKIGIHYQEEKPAREELGDLGIILGVQEAGVTILWVDPESISALEKGDVLTAFNNQTVTPLNFWEFYNSAESMAIGETYEVEIFRDGRRKRVREKIIPLKYRHIFTPARLLTPRQEKVRSAWLKNLD